MAVTRPAPAAAPSGPIAKKLVAPATAAERDAAMRLGAIYEYVSVTGGLPLDKRSIPTIVATPPAVVLAAASVVYGTDGEIKRRFDRGLYRGTTVYPSKPALYKKDYTAVIERVYPAAVDFAVQALTEEALALGRLRLRVEQEPGLAETLHGLCMDIVKEGKGLEPTDKELDASYDTVIPASTKPEWNSKTGKVEMVPAGPAQRRDLNERKLRFAVRSRYAPLVHAKQHPVLSTLYLDGSLELLASYADSAQAGTRFAGARLTRAEAAVSDLRRSLAAPENANHIWRYEMFLRGGIRSLGLQDVTGLTNYVLQVGKVLGGSSAETWIAFASVAVACLGFMFTGPVGLAVVAAADFSLTAAGTSLVFLREHEQELASRGSAFRSDGNKFAAAPDYTEAGLAAAASLLCGLAFFRSLGSLRNLLRGETGAARTVTAAAPKDVPGVGTKTSKTDLTVPLDNRASEVAAGTASDARRLEQKATDGAPPAPAKTSAAADEVTPIVDSERGVGEATKSNKAQETTGKGTPRPLPGGGDADPLDINRAIREERKQELRAAKQAVEAEIAKVKAQMTSVDRNKVLAREQMTEAYKRGDRTRLESVRKRLQTLTEERPTLGDLGDRLKQWDDLLNGTEDDYYRWLTSTAARESEYVSVAAGVPDPRFRTGGVTAFEVEHAMARSRIFALPGFEKLTPRQQALIFSYRDNLSKIPAAANAARGNRPYATLSPEFIAKWFKDTTSWEAAVAHEAKMFREITAMVKNPSLIPQPGKRSWFRIKEELEALGRKFPMPETVPAPPPAVHPGMVSPISPVSDPRLIDDASRGLGAVRAPRSGTSVSR